MLKISTITPRFSITSAMTEAAFAEAAALGYKSVISNRPDGEDPTQLTAKSEAALAWRAGMKFRHIPASKHDVFTDDVVQAMVEALKDLEGPILAHCQSGTRSAIIWAAASARSQSVDCVLDALDQADLDLSFLRDDLEAQADRKHWIGPKEGTALDCGCDGDDKVRRLTSAA